MQIETGIKFFGQKVLLESTGDKDVDMALKSLFRDDYNKTAPLSMDRIDAKLVLAWQRKK